MRRNVLQVCDGRSWAWPSSRFPAPVSPKSASMPPQDGCMRMPGLADLRQPISRGFLHTATSGGAPGFFLRALRKEGFKVRVTCPPRPFLLLAARASPIRLGWLQRPDIARRPISSRAGGCGFCRGAGQRLLRGGRCAPQAWSHVAARACLRACRRAAATSPATAKQKVIRLAQPGSRSITALWLRRRLLSAAIDFDQRRVRCICCLIAE